MSFFEQYKHPEWQKLRLMMFQKSDFSCHRCGDSDSQLHLHHKRYVKGRKVWEYTESELEVLCDACHETAHVEKEIIQSLIASLPTDAIREVIWLLAGYCSSAPGPASQFNDIEAPEEFADPFSLAIGKLAGECAYYLTHGGIEDIRSSIKKAQETNKEVSVSIYPRRCISDFEF